MTAPLLLALLLGAGPARAADDKASAPAAVDTDTAKLADYFLKTPTSQADPKLVEPFLAVDPSRLPERQRGRVSAKQSEINALLKVHDRKKKGNWVTPASCPIATYVKPLEQFPDYRPAKSCRKEDYNGSAWCEISEDEEAYIQHKTGCTLEDQGCEFTLIAFVDLVHKKKPRRLVLNTVDQLTAIAVESGHGGQTNFFGAGVTCYHQQ
jgi:hypothetical protein